jgi:hypothetical protein
MLPWESYESKRALQIFSIGERYKLINPDANEYSL